MMYMNTNFKCIKKLTQDDGNPWISMTAELHRNVTGTNSTCRCM